ncbi:4a-hydroxytetrahydrobiopterin dehydratase [Spirulina sp. 06S082]|uniref:4a-hydroxytetrahydrobiopterin dehydratase n=1 Tax=Spirulina sp. 06S082 TaxID=3110248 RepID=UPI002B1F289F|nr:4a-hydroxytetrahydrobiopterin dehydratase [Spirulina sp. 06S082]MEA5468234.1 4a-hydroxytetrahydrobiopterin dehydratase [Spirulina sp. 06S082]
MAQLLNQTEIQARLKTLTGWKQNGKVIQQTFRFKDFIAAIAFVNELVEPAETAGHHPDLEISYNKVTVSMTSHDAGGLTSKDFDMAMTISELAEKLLR